MEAATLVMYALGGYLAIGALVGPAFVSLGVGRVDGAARGSSFAFRILILPGCAALWPLVLVRWRRGAR